MSLVSSVDQTKMTRSAFHRPMTAISVLLLSCTALTAPAFAADGAPAPDENAEIVVTGSLGALPLKNVGTVFGFDKTLVETPRSASSVSAEQMERFGMTDIYDLVSQVPGTFTNSYFGTGGALDIRGSPADVYFRGMRRLDNPGNYPTPIGASDRIDIIRGPSSPIYGPSKTGGYMNFVPKSARAANGAFVAKTSGYMSYTRSSWEGNDIKGAITGPGSVGDHPFGYSLYGEIEDSGSYYRNMSTRQTVLQASFDTDITDNLRTEFGGMYQHFSGQQNGGWNRLTQDLIDNGTYITGAAKPLDTNGDGQISRGEARAANGGKGLNPFGDFDCSPSTVTTFTDGPKGLTNACLTATWPDLALTNPGTAQLSRRDTLTGENDFLKDKQTTGYFDLIYDGPDELEIKNQLFFDGTHNLNNNDYGFSQFIHSYVVEDKIVVAKSFTNSLGKFSFQLSPSLRYTHFKFHDDFDIEEFNRVDLTVGYNALSNRLLSNECDCDYSHYTMGHYTDLGFAGLTDLDFDFGLDITLGARYDHVKATSATDQSKIDPLLLASPPGFDDSSHPASAKGHDNGWSWNASASYELPFGIRPYVTASRQSTIVVGEGSEIYPDAVAANNFIAASKLYEAGIKGEFLDKRLYAAVSVYNQKRSDFNNQNTVTNQSVKTKGIEAELRWSVNKHLLVSGAYTLTNVYELTGLNTGSTFSFFGANDMPAVTPSLFFGGQPIGNLPITTKAASRRAGIPKNLYSATATYAFNNGIALSGDVTHVDAVYSGQSQAVRLPGYWLLNLGVSYTTGPWLARLVIKNVNNARYFRANFTELFGSTIALPEVPRNFQATLEYKF
jgi:iron complex outermembrane receptor protein